MHFIAQKGTLAVIAVLGIGCIPTYEIQGYTVMPGDCVVTRVQGADSYDATCTDSGEGEESAAVPPGDCVVTAVRGPDTYEAMCNSSNLAEGANIQADDCVATVVHSPNQFEALCSQLDLAAVPPTLSELVRASSCDVLPERDTVGIVGALAHPRGYPRVVGGMIQFDSLTPHETPAPQVIWALTQGNTFENEVHDCQRLVFVTAADSSFGPLVGVVPLDSAMILPDGAFSSGRVVATVHNWGDTVGNAQPYDTLDIGDGWNCLWLRHDGSGRWSAAMTPDDSIPCFDRASPAASLYVLDVQRATHEDSIPKTARIGWDAVAAVHTIGVKCGDEWCWVGPPEIFEDDQVQLVGPAHTTIPGYFDEQHLAVPDSNGGFVPGPYARVSPTAGYYRLARAQHATDADITGPFFAADSAVAVIEMPGFNDPTPPPYAELWGSSQRPVVLHLSRWGTGFKSTFRNAASQDVTEFPSKLTVGVSHSAVGTVRWRWHDTAGTETIWSACGEKLTDCCDNDNRKLR